MQIPDDWKRDRNGILGCGQRVAPQQLVCHRAVDAGDGVGWEGGVRQGQLVVLHAPPVRDQL